MKRYYVDILQIAAGTVVGTALVVGYFWSMLGGVFLIFPFWVLVGLFVLFWASIVLVGLKAGYKGIVAVMASFLLGWFGFNALHQQVCGPNAEDVKVMKPMAEKISAYIVKHGIPERLEEIPDLPYRLEGCANKSSYIGSKFDEKRHEYSKVSSRKEAMSKVIEIDCIFHANSKKYIIDIHGSHRLGNEGLLYMNIDGNRETGVQYVFKIKKNETIVVEDSGAYSTKTSGICNPMRQ